MVFNKNVDDVLTNDIYFGQQLPLGNIGFTDIMLFGLGFNLAQGFGVIYPTIGSSFGYSFKKFHHECTNVIKLIRIRGKKINKSSVIVRQSKDLPRVFRQKHFP
jgi:hypothetical protein